MHNYARTTPNFTPTYTASLVNRSLGKRMWSGWPVCAAVVLCTFCTFLILPLGVSLLGSAISTTDKKGATAMAFFIGGLCLIFFFTTCVYIKCKKIIRNKNRSSNCNNTDNLQSLPSHSQALYTDTDIDVRGITASELDFMINQVQQGANDNNNTTNNINYDPPSYDTAMANNTSTNCRNATTRTLLNSIGGREVPHTTHGVYTTGNAGESSIEETRTVTDATPETDRHSTPNDICAPPSCNVDDISTPPSYGNTIYTLPSYKTDIRCTLPSYSNHISTPPDYNDGACASSVNYSNDVNANSIVNYNTDRVTATVNITDISASTTTADAVPTCSSDPPTSVICDTPPAYIPPTANENEDNDNRERTPPPTYSDLFFK